MDTSQFIQRDETCWEIQPKGVMRVPAIIYADAQLLQDMDQKVYEQITNVTTLPGIVAAARHVEKGFGQAKRVYRCLATVE